MARTRVLTVNQSNWNAAARRFVYKLPQIEKFEKAKFGLSSMMIYNSFQNVSASNMNNTVRFIFPATFTKNPLTGATISAVSSWTFDWVIPDGYYSVSDLNSWFQQQMVKYKLYCTRSNGNFNYFFSLTNNLTQYKVSMNFQPVMDSDPSTLTIPDGAGWAFSGAQLCPSVSILNAAFGLLIGFTTGTYGGGSDEVQNILSNSSSAAQISTISALHLGTNLYSDSIFTRPDAFFCTPITVGTGFPISPSIPSVNFLNVTANSGLQYIEISVYDQDGNQLVLFDTQATISLTILET